MATNTESGRSNPAAPRRSARGFIDRSTNTVLAESLALNAFRAEVAAEDTPVSSGDVRWSLQIDSFGSPMMLVGPNNEVNPEPTAHPKGMIPAIRNDGTGLPARNKQHSFHYMSYSELVTDLYGNQLQFPIILACESWVTSGPYWEDTHPTDKQKWGYYRTSIQFSWSGVVYISANPDSEHSGVDSSGGGQLVDIRFDYDGSAEINAENGSTTVHSPPVEVTVGFVRGPHRKGGVPFSAMYRCTKFGGSDKEASFTMKLEVWEPYRMVKSGSGWENQMPFEDEPALTEVLSDKFSYSKFSYPKP